uniref:Retrovirus-related Pol polyprotein from transposon TNT 1-94 n=1 Tax=Tanacetum cinerariifolium TaxID=118510 RepID=A0A699GIS8_TANCI|nr:hypothetical protein [Tanacetum cinerariifolium]
MTMINMCLTGKVEFAMKTVSILKRKRSHKVIKEIGQSKEAIDDEDDSKRTDEEEVVPLVRRRLTGVSIGRKDYQESEVVEGIDHFNKLKGLVTLSETAQYKLDIKKAQKASKDDFFMQQRSKGPGEGSGVTPEVPDVQTLKRINEGVGMLSEVPDELSDESSSSSSDSKLAVEDISSVKIVDVEKDIDAQVAEEQPAGKHTRDEEHGANIEPARGAQADIELPKGVPNFKKIKLEKAAKKNVPKTSWNKIATAIYDQKSRLYRMMDEVKAFNNHPTRKALYVALAVSLSIDEDDMDRIFGDRSHQDFSKPLPLLSAHGRLYIPAKFFFNQDLEYIRSGNLEERKYTTSLIKTKAARLKMFYNLDRLRLELKRENIHEIESENNNAPSKSVNETQLKQHESLVTKSTTLEANLNMNVKALDVGSVITESSGTKSDKYDTSRIDVKNDLPKPVTPHYLPEVRESVLVKPHHVIASGSSRNTSKESYESNDMAHKYYLEVDKEKTQDKNMNLKPRTRNNNKPVKPKSHTQKPSKQIAIGQRLSLNNSSSMHEKPYTPRSCLRWKTTGRIFKIVCLGWIPTGKMFTDNTIKVESEPLNGSNDDITNSYRCDQTLNVSVGTLNLSAEVVEKQAGNVQTSLTLSSAKLEIQSMVDVPIHQEDPAVQRTPLIDTVILIVTNKTTSTPTPPTTQAQVQMCSTSC